MDLGIFRDGVLVERVALDPTIRNASDRGRMQTARAYDRLHDLAARMGPPGLANGYEVLRICPNHPERSVVDCPECDPEES